MTRCRVGFLFFKLPPVFHIGVVDNHLSPHFGYLPDAHLRAAVAGITHIFAVGDSEKRNFRGCDNFSHVSQGIPHKLGHMKRTGVVDIDGHRCNLKYFIFKPHQRMI